MVTTKKSSQQCMQYTLEVPTYVNLQDCDVHSQQNPSDICVFACIMTIIKIMATV